MLAREHVSLQDTMTREYISVQGTLAHDYGFGKQGTQFSRLDKPNRVVLPLGCEILQKNALYMSVYHN